MSTLESGEEMRPMETIRRGVHYSPELKDGIVGTLLLKAFRVPSGTDETSSSDYRDDSSAIATEPADRQLAPAP